MKEIFKKGIICLVLIAISISFYSVNCDKYPLLNHIPETNFSCWRRSPGYYADPSEHSRCQVYHMCQSSGRVYSYLCPNHTLFDQDRLICDHWFKVNCSNIENRYKVNDQIFLESLAKIPKRRASNLAPVPTGRKPVDQPINNSSSRSSVSSVTSRRRVGLSVTTVVATVTRVPSDQSTTQQGVLSTRPRPGGIARRKLVFGSPDDVVISSKIQKPNATLLGLTPRRIDFKSMDKIMVKDLDDFEPVKIIKNSILTSASVVCPGCLEYFMIDKRTCTPCVGYIMLEISRGLENRPVLFENHVDNEIPPNWWTYIASNIPGPGSDKDKFDTGYGNCHCAGDCNTTSCTCTKSYQTKLGIVCNEYIDGNQNLKPIIECGLNCHCNPEECFNRVVQNGIQVSLYVFKTENERGFGVKTQESIQKGAFICEYAGEIIGKEEATKRFSTQSEQDSNYIHILKEHFSTIIETIIDPTYLGNVGRFINHSCHPNLTAIPIRAVNSVPRLCFFANIYISPNTELTYNYGGDSDCLIGTKLCKCEVPNCKKFLPYDKNL